MQTNQLFISKFYVKFENFQTKFSTYKLYKIFQKL